MNRRYLLEGVSRRKEYYIGKLGSMFRRKQIIEAYFNSAERRKLNLGSGENLLEGWLNSDILNVKDGMIFLDVRHEFPFENNSFDFVYSEHLLEHLSYEDGVYLLQECFRVLKYGGTCRISTPDLAFLVDFYQNVTPENREYLKWAFDVYWRSSTRSKAQGVNYYMRDWGHKCIYDFELLKDTCERVGFRNVRKQKVGESDVPDLKAIERHGDVITIRWNAKESLVVEMEKMSPGE